MVGLATRILSRYVGSESFSLTAFPDTFLELLPQTSDPYPQRAHCKPQALCQGLTMASGVFSGTEVCEEQCAVILGQVCGASLQAADAQIILDRVVDGAFSISGLQKGILPSIQVGYVYGSP